MNNRIRFLFLSILAAVPMLAGCNTMQGLGRDLQQVGERMEDDAANAQ